MKILWVKPGKLLPLDSGGKLRTYNILRHLSAAHGVTLLTYYSGPRDLLYEEEILKHFPGAIPLYTGVHAPVGFRRKLDYLLRLPDATPYAVSQFAAPCVRTMIARWMKQPCFDVVVCDFLASTPNFPRDLAIPTVLFQHNVESVLWKRRAEFETRWFDRIVARIESFKMSLFEPAQVRRFHHVFAVSNEDARSMSLMTDSSHITVIPTGVDLSTFPYDPQAEAKDPLVVFTGSMDWAPNIDAVEYFCKEIWPHVLNRVPEARFRIVGRRPHPRVEMLASDSVEVTGSVPSTVGHLREAAVVAVPLRAGGGTRIKIYEGMAMGKAMVSTGIGAEGLDVHRGHDILIADEPGEFAESIISLLTNRQKRRNIEVAAANTAQKHDWSRVAAAFEAALHNIIQRQPSRVAVPSEVPVKA